MVQEEASVRQQGYNFVGVCALMANNNSLEAGVDSNIPKLYCRPIPTSRHGLECGVCIAINSTALIQNCCGLAVCFGSVIRERFERGDLGGRQRGNWVCTGNYGRDSKSYEAEKKKSSAESHLGCRNGVGRGDKIVCARWTCGASVIPLYTAVNTILSHDSARCCIGTILLRTYGKLIWKSHQADNKDEQEERKESEARKRRTEKRNAVIVTQDPTHSDET